MNVAFIPVRGGSKSIPLKNIKEFCGKPLVYWTVNAACECAYIDKVYVATDSVQIKGVIQSFQKAMGEIGSKIMIIDRSAESSTDTASTEFAMLEFAEKYDFDNIVLIQATSPLLTGADLSNGFEVFRSPDTDSVLSVVKQKRFHWGVDQSGIAAPTNYDVFHRPRRQEFEGYFVENGAFYITSKKNLIESGNRVSGKIRISEMPENTFFEIDEPDDWVVLETLMQNKLRGNRCDKRKHIKMLLTDCDGCLTDGGMYYSEYGDEMKKFNTRDGMGVSILKEHGIITGIITGESVELNIRRAEKLKLDIIEVGCKDKLAKIRELCNIYHITMEEIVYIGDDLNDLEVVESVGFGCCPADAALPVQAVADYVAKAKGGEGVLREVVDLLFEER